VRGAAAGRSLFEGVSAAGADRPQPIPVR